MRVGSLLSLPEKPPPTHRVNIGGTRLKMLVPEMTRTFLIETLVMNQINKRKNDYVFNYAKNI